MTRISFDAPFRLLGSSWTLFINGLDINQDLYFEANAKRFLLSDPGANFEELGFISPVAGKRLAFHFDLDRIPSSVTAFSFQVSARAQAHVDWYFRSPDGTHYDSEGILLLPGVELEILDFRRSQEWLLTSRKRDLQTTTATPANNLRLPENLRQLHLLAGNLQLAANASEVAVVVDSSASMLGVQKDPAFFALIEALRAISLTVTLKPLRIRVAGHPSPVEVGPLDNAREALAAVMGNDDDVYREIEPMMGLVPKMIGDEGFIRKRGKLFCVSDTWFFIGKEVAAELEAREIDLVLIKLLEDESGDEPVRFSHPQVSTRVITGLGTLRNPDSFLRELA